MKNDGLQNEKDIIETLDGKKFYELPTFWQHRLKQLDKTIQENDEISCFKCVYNKKADIAIKSHDKRWNISIKSGYFISVHNELLSSFVGFLRSLGISEELLNVLKLYHYGDDTTDGTGEVRHTLVEIKEKMADDIERFNKEVNKKEILTQIIDRCLFSGTPYQKSYVSHIYYGTKDYGNMINKKIMTEYIVNAFKCDTKAIYFGPLIYTPAYRGVNNFDKDNKHRYYVNIKWPSIGKDIKDAKQWYFDDRESDYYIQDRKKED